MENYINDIKAKYSGVFKELSKRRSSGALGEIVREVFLIAKSQEIESSKAEIRDALMAFATGGELKIEKYQPKRLEVKFLKREEGDLK